MESNPGDCLTTNAFTISPRRRPKELPEEQGAARLLKAKQERQKTLAAGRQVRAVCGQRADLRLPQQEDLRERSPPAWRAAWPPSGVRPEPSGFQGADVQERRVCVGVDVVLPGLYGGLL